MAGSLDGQSIPNQVEAIYVAYFGRAADGNGQLYWVNQFNTDLTAGLSTDQAAVMISNSFAVQPEAKAMYAFLNSPPITLNPADPTQIAAADNLITSAYLHLFNRVVPVTDPGVLYWQGQILGGAVSVGSALYAIANGATGADAAVLAEKIAAATTFTNDTFAVNLGGVDPATGQLTPSFATAAQNSVTPVVDATTLAASQAASAAFAAALSTPTLTLTPGVDNISTATSDAVFSAPLVTASILAGGQIVGGSSTNLQTLTVGDTMLDSSNSGILNATLATTANGTLAIVPNVTMSGISAANVSVVTGGLQGFEGNVTGLTTVNDNNSNGGLQLGVPGAGLNTALVNVSVNGYTGGDGTTVFAGFIAAAAGSASNIINVSLSGTLGDTSLFGADTLLFGTDGPPGTKASPNLSYGVWGITAHSNAVLQLEQNGVGGAATLALLGAGNIALGTDAPGNWQTLTTIDASSSTGNVTITGHSAGADGNAQNSDANPGGLFGSIAGLLDGNTSLTLYKLSTGVNFLDVSSESTPGVIAGLTTDPGSNILLDNTIVVSSADADTISPTTFANIKGFQILGVAGAGAHTGTDTGTIDMANLPSTIDDILYQTTAAGDLTINNAPATLLTVDTEDNGNGFALTINAPAAGSAHVIVGNATTSDGGDLGGVTMTGEQTVDFTAQGGHAVTDFFGSVSLTPASLSGSVSVTIDGSSAADFGGGGGGAIFDLAFGVTPPTLDVNNLSITVTDTNIVTFHEADFGPLTAPIAGNTTDTAPYSTNALSIDAHASGGLVMLGGDANFSTLNSTGDTITGSTTGSNLLSGSVGNDAITGSTSTTAVDTVVTGGGADTITLGPGHTTSDHVDLYAGSGGAPGEAADVFSTFLGFGITSGSITDSTDAAQIGWFGVQTNGAAAEFGVLNGHPNTGTSATQAVVSNFTSNDVIDLGVDAWGRGGTNHDPVFPGENFGLTIGDLNTQVTPGGPTVIQQVNPGDTVNTATNVIDLSTGTFLNANAVVEALHSPGAGAYAITFDTPSFAVNNDNAHVIVAYQDQNNIAHLMDLDIVDTGVPPAGLLVTNATDVNLYGSDMVQLSGVSVTNLHAANIHFV